MKATLGLLLGLAVGLGLGFLIGWGLYPVQYYNTQPADLRVDYQEDYIQMVALTFSVEGGKEAALQRLRLLDAEDPTRPLIALTERLAQQPVPPESCAALARLAHALSVETPVMRPCLELPLP